MLALNACTCQPAHPPPPSRTTTTIPAKTLRKRLMLRFIGPRRCQVPVALVKTRVTYCAPRRPRESEDPSPWPSPAARGEGTGAERKRIDLDDRALAEARQAVRGRVDA